MHHLNLLIRRAIRAATALTVVALAASCGGGTMPAARTGTPDAPVAGTAAPEPTTATRLSEARNWGLQLDVSLDSSGKPRNGAFEYRNLRCSGTYTFTGVNAQKEFVLQQDLKAGRCVKGCQLLIKADWTGYREICKGQVSGSGDLAGGEALARAVLSVDAAAPAEAVASAATAVASPSPGSPPAAAGAAGIWTDPGTGLSWAKCMARRDGTVPVDPCRGELAELTWPEAMAFARSARLGGHSDWRLPTPKELATLGRDRSIEWWSTVWTPAAAGGGVEVGCRHFGNSGSCGARRVSYAWRLRVVLVRGGTPDNTFSQALSDPAVVQRLQQEAGERKEHERLTATLAKGKDVGDKWGLLDHAPTALTTQPAVDEGSLQPMDWYVHGLRSEEARRRGLRSEFLAYLNSRRLLDYKAHFSSPFDKQNFEQQLAAEKKGFVDRLFDHAAQPLPKRIYTFTPIKLEGYDMDSEVLRISTCRDLGLYNTGGANGMRCGSAGVVFPDQALEPELHKLASAGPLAASGRVRYVKFSTFFNGDNTGAPLYILNRGLPSVISMRMPKDEARALFDMAKLTTVRPQYRDEYGGKMLAAKILYDAPRPKGFVTSNAVHKEMFVTFTGGAAVTYETQPLAICFYDGAGSTPLACRSVGAVPAAKPRR